jgi:hypothetical protein
MTQIYKPVSIRRLKHGLTTVQPDRVLLYILAAKRAVSGSSGDWFALDMTPTSCRLSLMFSIGKTRAVPSFHSVAMSCGAH